MRWPRGIMLLSLATILAVTIQAAAGFLPPLRHRWQTFATRHFRFYFYRETEALARALAPQAEQVHARLLADLGMAPEEPTHVLIYDDTDEYNGWATVSPRNTIALYATGPYPGGYGRIGGSLLETFVHEYTHILQLGYVEDITGAIRGVLGEVLKPNVFLPPWCAEGLAVAMESEFFPTGRLHASTWRMLLRADFLAGRELSWPRVANGVYRWPYANAWYLYGSFFTRHLMDRYGREKVAALYRATAASPPYLGFGRIFAEIFGLEFEEAVAAWYEKARREFLAEAGRIRSAGLREGRPVAEYGGRSGQGFFGPGGDLFFVRRTYDAPVRLMRAAPPYRGARSLAVLPAGRPALAPDGKTVAFGQLTLQGENLFSDLYAYDLASRRVTRLSRGLRAADPSWSPDGREIALIRNAPPNYSLYRLDCGTGRALPIWEASGPEQAFTPAWSPAGGRIAFSRYRPQDGLRIWLVNPGGGEPSPLHPGPSLGEETDPAWSPDGRIVYFSADPDGIANIYACDPATLNVWRVTNVLTGAFAPAVSSDGRTLAYTGYSHLGYDQYVMELDRATWLPIRLEDPEAGSPAALEQTSGYYRPMSAAPDVTPASGYSPWETLEPHLAYLSAEIGPGGGPSYALALAGRDVLETVAYQLNVAGAGPGPGYDLQLSLRLAPCSLGLRASRLFGIDPKSGGLRRDDLTALGAEGADGGFAWSLWAYQKASAFLEPPYAMETILGAVLDLGYDATESYRGPVDLRLGHLLEAEIGAEKLVETGETMLWQTAGGMLFLPLTERARLELGLKLGHNSLGLGRADLGVPWIPGPQGYLVWDAGALLEFPLLQPEAGGMTAPGYIHAVNGLAAVRLGQALNPWGLPACSYGIGADLRLQLGYSLPLDLYLLLLWTPGTGEPNLVFWAKTGMF
ncbi:MAG: TolB family protein [Patescibacteria group bacterium]